MAGWGIEPLIFKRNHFGLSILIHILCLPDHNKKGANMNNRTMEYGWRQNKDHVGEATC